MTISSNKFTDGVTKPPNNSEVAPINMIGLSFISDLKLSFNGVLGKCFTNLKVMK